jgi:hypothetical protein
VGELENGCRTKHKLPEIDWTEEMKLGLNLFGEKSRGSRSTRFHKSDKLVLYFKTVCYGPLNFLVYADETKNQKSFFYSLIKSMDEDCEVNKDIAGAIAVSKMK